MEIRRKLLIYDLEDYCSQSLICAFLENMSATDFSAILEKAFIENIDKINKLLLIAANVFSEEDYSSRLFGTSCARYGDKLLIQKIEDFFTFVKFDDSDYINIYNLKEGNNFDRILKIQSDFVSCKDCKMPLEKKNHRFFSYLSYFSSYKEYYRHDFKVLVKKGFEISTDKTYPIEELIQYSKKGFIVFVDESLVKIKDLSDSDKIKKNAKKCENIKIDRSAFLDLEKLIDDIHPYHSCFMSYFLCCITRELIDESIKEIAENCSFLLEKPSNESIIESYLRFRNHPISIYLFREELYFKMQDEKYTFDGRNIHNEKEALEYILTYEMSNNLIESAKEMLSKYSNFLQQFL